MADDGMSRSVRPTFESVESLQSVVNAIPQLKDTTLKGQLQATASLCISLQQHPGLLDSEGSEQVVNLLLRIGTYAVRVKEGIQATHLTGSVNWSTCLIEGRTVSGIASYIQLLTSSVFVGAVGEALSQRRVRLSPEAKIAYRELIADTASAAASEAEAIIDRQSRIMEGLTLSNS